MGKVIGFEEARRGEDRAGSGHGLRIQHAGELHLVGDVVRRRSVRRKQSRRASRECDQGTPTALAAWIHTHREPIDSLSALRRLGNEGSDALEALLATRSVATVRASWELFEALAEGDGDDPELLLLKVLSPSQLESARRALWGPRWDAEVVTDA